MKFIPILFSTEMVYALLAGRKTMTRRIIKSPSGSFAVETAKFEPEVLGYYHNRRIEDVDDEEMSTGRTVLCPYGHTGDVLWVRETFYAYGRWVKNGFSKTRKQKYKFNDFTLLSNSDFQYKYEDCKPQRIKTGRGNEIGWYKRPSLFMPKEACRTFLQITDIRVERLQDISEEDAAAEGVETLGLYPGFDMSNKGTFEGLWFKINGPDSWNDNPWVWVVTFKRIEKPESFI